MSSLEIVSHVYCPPGVPQYARMLRYQAASLLHWPPDARHRVTLTVCHAPRDHATREVVESLATLAFPPQVSLASLALPEECLFRRAIGRNMRARATTADVVWFTDVDYFFAEHCLDDVLELVGRDSGLRLPATIMIHRDHATGDEELLRTRGVLAPRADLSRFVERRQRIAIGGVQIIGGDVARRIGYLDATSWVEPVDPALGFRSCRCDHAWRRHNRLEAVRLPIRGVYRQRHTTDGRDYAMDGRKIGREAW